MVFAILNSILFLILISSLSVLAQNSSNITTGSTMTATANSNPWLSPSGDFAFGFQPLQTNTDLFILSIWFNRIPDRTIVWFERNSYPVPSGSTLRLDAVGLVLRDSRGRLLWNISGYADEVAYGYMNDTGNFILSGSNSVWLWQSFSNPTDTILPVQTLEINAMLVSRMTRSNFTRGGFCARMLENGNFVFNTQSVPSNIVFDEEYYNSQTSDTNASNSGYQVLFNGRGQLSVMHRNGQQVVLSRRSVPPDSENYYRATLDFEGVFTQYYHPRSFSGNPGWTVAGSWPDNICVDIIAATGGGACGYNSICTLQNQRPVCHCPQGFSLRDPNNPYGDCFSRFNPSCTENASAFAMLRVPDTDWPMNDYEQIEPCTEDNCRNACLSDCLCSASTYRSNRCWKKKLPLTNGRVDTTIGVTAYLKYRVADIPEVSPDLPIPNQERRNRTTLILSVLLGSSVFFILLLIGAGCLGYFLVYKSKTSILNSVQSSAGAALRCFTYKELVQATNEFEEELGRGAFGVVYKGEMPDSSKTIVAVKKLNIMSDDSDKEFRAEVNTIGQTHHKNLVRLLGFCDEGPNRLLVYEYMSNGSLSDILFGNSRRSWSLRSQIALGVARGLTYLHEECSTQIIHCDIKPQNILIDEYFNARIADFGLAKLLAMNQTQTLTNIRGTKGYVAPEWFMNIPVTTKVDVYNFGVLLLEIISCRKSVADMEKSEDEEHPILTDWVWDCYQDKELDRLVEDDTEALSDRVMLERFVVVALWCIQEDSSLRPTIRKASQMLEGIVQVANPPCPSPFSTTI